MARRLWLLLVFAASAHAQENLFDPADEAFTLRPLTQDQFRRLKPREQLVERGLDPLLWVEPPPEPDSVLQDSSVRAHLYPGFRYAERLEAKQKLFRRILGRASVAYLVDLLASLELPPPTAFQQSYWQSAAKVAPAGQKPLMQSVNALRHAERQFRNWFLDELGAILARRLEIEQGLALRLLGKELVHPDTGRRRRCARVLGAWGHPEAARLLERALTDERDPEAIGALVAARARIGGPRIKDLLVLWVAHPDWHVRLGAIRALEAMGDGWAQALLRDRTTEEKGRLRDDVWTALGGEPRGDVDFYGIRTNSRRILFCIDTSGSMAFPIDGKNGELEPRFRRARRELSRTLRALPADVRFNVQLFSDQVHLWQRRLVPATEKTKELALGFLREAQLVGGTNLDAAIQSALQCGADTVFLLTDGEASVGSLLDSALILEEMAAKNAHGRVVIHTIGLSRDQNAALLVNLAQRTKGHYRADR